MNNHIPALRQHALLLVLGLSALGVCSICRIGQGVRDFYADAGLEAVLGRSWVAAASAPGWRNLRLQNDLYAALHAGPASEIASVRLNDAVTAAPTADEQAAVRFAQGVFAENAGHPAIAVMHFNQVLMLLRQAHRADLLQRFAVHIGRRLLLAGDSRDAARWEQLVWPQLSREPGPLARLAANTLARAWFTLHDCDRLARLQDGRWPLDAPSSVTVADCRMRQGHTRQGIAAYLAPLRMASEHPGVGDLPMLPPVVDMTPVAGASMALPGATIIAAKRNASAGAPGIRPLLRSAASNPETIVLVCQLPIPPDDQKDDPWHHSIRTLVSNRQKLLPGWHTAAA